MCVYSPFITALIFCTSPQTTSRVCAAVVRASSTVSRSNLSNTASTSFSPNSFFTSFTILHSDQWHIDGDTLTRSLLLDLFRHQGERGNHFHHDFHDHLGHSCRQRNSGINIEAIDEVFYRFEQLDESIIAGADVLDRLTHLHVTRTYTWEIKKDHTARRMANAANMAFAGGNGCEYSIRTLEHLLDTFSSDVPAQ